MKQLVVGISDAKTARAPDILTTYGLGSCMGIALYDEALRTGGLLHILLPDSRRFEGATEAYRFADTGLQRLVSDLERQGVDRRRLWAKIAGGSSMFRPDKGKGFDIGEQNIRSVRETLVLLGIPLKAMEVGGHGSRTLRFDLETGLLAIRKIENGSVTLVNL